MSAAAVPVAAPVPASTPAGAERIPASALPPGPRLPVAATTAAWVLRPVSTVERLRRRYGPTFCLRIAGRPPLVVVGKPADVKAVLTAPADVLHPGAGAKTLEPLLGRHSLLLLDEDRHLAQRRLLLPAFHGERIKALRDVVREEAEAHVARWPAGDDVAVHEPLAELALDIILRAVFGVRGAQEHADLRAALLDLLALSVSPAVMVSALRERGSRSRSYRRFLAARDRVDGIVYPLIARRRAEDAGGADMLAMLLQATHEDGSPMSDEEVRDELVTLLVAGHETTASGIAWALLLLAHHPAEQDALVASLAAGDGKRLTAVVQEALRMRPVAPNAVPRLAMEPFALSDREVPAGVVLLASALMVHFDPEVHERPHAFRPDRFLERPPGTYTWIPWGGGRRRCIGAAFAHLELEQVLTAVLARFHLGTGGRPFEHARRRTVTITPADGARLALSPR